MNERKNRTTASDGKDVQPAPAPRMIEAFTLVAPRKDVASGHEERVPLFVRKPHPPQREIPNARGTKNHLSSHHVSRQTRRNEHSAHFCAKRDRFPRRSILARASFPAISHFSRLKISPRGGLFLFTYIKRARFESAPVRPPTRDRAIRLLCGSSRTKKKKRNDDVVLKTNERTVRAYLERHGLIFLCVLCGL